VFKRHSASSPQLRFSWQEHRGVVISCIVDTVQTSKPSQRDADLVDKHYNGWTASPKVYFVDLSVVFKNDRVIADKWCYCFAHTSYENGKCWLRLVLAQHYIKLGKTCMTLFLRELRCWRTQLLTTNILIISHPVKIMALL